VNKQIKTKNGAVVSRGIEWCDYTWNPVVGCLHGCRWTMPNGKTAICYAEAQVEGSRLKPIYSDGFETAYWMPDRLNQPAKAKAPSKIFVGSMADVLGAWVPEDQIRAILETAECNPQHTFIFLTKNIRRALNFRWPKNCWVGVSTPPDEMFGKPLTRKQQTRMLSVAIAFLTDLKIAGMTTWLSAEPLSWDISGLLEMELPRAGLGMRSAIDWCVIGAASDNGRNYPPDAATFERTRDILSGLGVKLFYKGNLRSLPEAAAGWKEDFPDAR